jgi:hypothetical protein
VSTIRHLLLAATLLSGVAFGQGPAGREVMTLVEVTSRDPEDKGAVPVGEQLTRSVVVKNVSHFPVRLSVGAKSCSCLKAQAEPEVIKPGESSTLAFAVSVAGSPEPQRYTTVFKAQADIGNGVRMTQDVIAGLKYVAQFEYMISPKRLNLVVVQGSPFDASVFLQAPATSEIHPERGSTPWEGVALTSEQKPLLEGDNQVWRLHLTGTFAEVGLKQGTARFSVRGAADDAAVPITVRVLPRWRSVPAGVAVDAADAPEPISRTLRLVASLPGSVPPPVRARVTPLDPGISAELVDQGSPAVRVTVNTTRCRTGGDCTVELIDERGSVVGTLPIVIYRADGIAPGK